METRQKIPRALYATKRLIQKYGTTTGCPACAGLSGPHSANHRGRITEAVYQDTGEREHYGVAEEASAMRDGDGQTAEEVSAGCGPRSAARPEPMEDQTGPRVAPRPEEPGSQRGLRPALRPGEAGSFSGSRSAPRGLAGGREHGHGYLCETRVRREVPRPAGCGGCHGRYRR